MPLVKRILSRVVIADRNRFDIAGASLRASTRRLLFLVVQIPTALELHYY
jgi:hypothetical protein